MPTPIKLDATSSAVLALVGSSTGSFSRRSIRGQLTNFTPEALNAAIDRLLAEQLIDGFNMIIDRTTTEMLTLSDKGRQHLRPRG